jgi:hypothetical protein
VIDAVFGPVVVEVVGVVFGAVDDAVVVEVGCVEELLQASVASRTPERRKGIVREAGEIEVIEWGLL